MKILVTGGAGFIGTNLIKRLVADGHDITSVDNYSTGDGSNHVDGCRYIRYNIQDYEIPIGFDLVYHLASNARIQPSFEHPKRYFESNANGTLNVVHYCVDMGIPLIHAGTSSKHGGRFENPYTFTKDIAEDIIELYKKHYGLKATITRFYNVYGDHQILGGEYSTLIGRWIFNIENNIPCEIYGDGEKRRDFTHVDDIIDALLKIYETKSYGYVFELGRGNNYSINEVAKMFGIKPKYLPNKHGESQITLNTSVTAQKVLDWNPTRNLEDYIIKELNVRTV